MLSLRWSNSCTISVVLLEVSELLLELVNSTKKRGKYSQISSSQENCSNFQILQNIIIIIKKTILGYSNYDASNTIYKFSILRGALKDCCQGVQSIYPISLHIHNSTQCMLEFSSLWCKLSETDHDISLSLFSI